MADRLDVPDTPAESLFNAVYNDDVETALNLLLDAGGPCAVRDLAREASQISRHSDKLKYSIAVEDGKETLTVYHTVSHLPQSHRPIAAVTNDVCQRTEQKK